MLRQFRDPVSLPYSVISFFGFLLSTLPLPWHLHAPNVGAWAYMIWTSFACLNGFVNSLVWKGNVLDRAPVWCDISSKLMVGVHIGIPASIACLSRRLYCIISAQSAPPIHQCKRYMVIVDLCISVGLPALIMILHYIIQAHRFDILEDIGCYPVVNNTLPAYFIFFVWPVLLGLVSVAYSAFTLSVFWVHRAALSRIIHTASAMSVSLYLRFMTLATLQAVYAVPLGVYAIYREATSSDISPWVSWEASHTNFSSVQFFPVEIWRAERNLNISVEITRWNPVASALLAFALLGLASEAREKYCKIFWGLPGMRRLRGLCGMKAVEEKFPSWIKPLKLRECPNTVSNLPPRYSHTSAETCTINEPFNETVQSLELEELGYGDPSYKHRSPLPRRPRIRSSLFEPSPPPRSPSIISSMSSPSSIDLTIINTEARSATPKPKTSREGPLRTMFSSDRFYLLPSLWHGRSVSPVPFADVAFVGSEHREQLLKDRFERDAPSFAFPDPAPSLLGGILVTVHTVSNVSR